MTGRTASNKLLEGYWYIANSTYHFENLLDSPGINRWCCILKVQVLRVI